jgi:PAS domain S-box-containing protein
MSRVLEARKREVQEPHMDTGEFLPLAIRITAALVEWHRKGVPHGNVIPSNIIIPLENDNIVLIDQLSGTKRSPTDEPYNLLSGAATPMAYMSPEQIRRLNQEVDCRADLYSLGVIFYEMLTGHLPFQAKDPLEWVHCHIARLPKSPADILASIPPLVSAIVMKLLSKAAEDRYQTAIGLQRDLEQCLSQWQVHGYLIPFVLGEADTSDQLFIPHRLYGREKDIEVLLKSFERVAEGGNPELMLVAGYSGIGKTSLVRELYKPVVRSHGHFIWGKFDQYKRNIPYATLIEAFQELIRQILAEREEVLVQWRVRLWDALGINGQLIVDIIPQLELIIGKQHPVAELPMIEAENRFRTIFCKFMGVFADEQHPLVLFLDDLQWVDSASLGLIEYILTEELTRYLLLIGAYRDNEVSLTHPLMLKLEVIRSAEVSIQTIHLQPLPFGDLRHLLADTFRSGQTQVDSLSRLVHEKTGGNAFFAIQFLRTLHREHLVRVDAAEKGWHWDIDLIQTKGYADNVVDLMVGNLKKLSPETQRLLRTASCIGNTFSIATLAAASKLPQEAVQEILWEAVQAGLILFGLADATCTFLHDRVQQSAYSLITANQRQPMHLEIGRLMLADTPPEMLEERIFDIVNQFNLGRDEVVDRDERYRTAKLNLIAARKAKNSSAYELSLNYLSLGAQFVDAEGWVSHYPLIYDLHKELALAQYVNSNYAESQHLIEVLLERAQSDIERAELYNILIVQHTLMGRYGDAIQIGKQGLKLLNVQISLGSLKDELDAELLRHEQILGTRTIQSLGDEPEMTDPASRVALELLSNMVVPSRYTDSTMFALISLLNVNLSLQYGPTPKSTVGYTSFGMFLNSALDRFADAYAFGELALKISERFNAPAQKCQACFMLGHYLSHWVRPLQCSDAFNDQGIEAGLASGERQWTGYTLAYKLFQPFYRGVRLETIHTQIPELLTFTGKTKNQWATDTLLGLQLALGTLEQSDGGGLLDSPSPKDTPKVNGEQEYLASCQEHKSSGALGRFNVLKAQICYLYGHLDEARKALVTAQGMLGYFSSSISVVELNFYDSLVLAATSDQASAAVQGDILATLERNQSKMRRWMEHCPENFSHLYHLVEAERARIEGKEFAAGRLYDRAIREASEQGFVQDEGLANELAGRFYLHNDFKRIAEAYLHRAEGCYRLWGADGKVQQMDRQYAGLLEKAPFAAQEEQGALIGALDAISVVKASQVISGEIVIANLVETLMQTVLENAGAQRGYLICERGADLIIEAEAWTDGAVIKVRQPETLLFANDAILPTSILNYVRRSRESVILDNASEESRYLSDAYISRAKPVSLLCLPVMRQARLTGILYLENNLMKGAFSPHRIAVLELLAAQAAISLENAELYQERSRAEEALSESEAKYRTIFDNSGTALIFIEEDMTMSMVNKEFETLTDYRKEEVEGLLKWLELVANPDDLQRMLQYHRLRRTTPGAAPQTYEFQLRARHGTVKDVVTTVTVLPGTRQSLAALLDISDRKRAEVEHLRLVTAIEQTDEAVFITDSDFVILYANPAFERMCGYGRHEIIGLHTGVLENEKHNRDFYMHVRQTLEHGNVWSGSMTCTKKDGSAYEAKVVSSPVRDQSGKVINYVSTHKDVTHELRLEEELRQSQKMEAIGTLAGGIAHDFNNILTVIMGNAELIQNSLAPNSLDQQRVQQLITSCTRAADLIQKILTFSRKTKQEKRPIHVVPIVKESLALLRSTLPSSIEIKQRFLVNPVSDVVLADPTQIHQILMNLCTNAAHAIGAESGMVEVTVSSVQVKEGLVAQPADLSSGPYLCIKVSDSGHGMEPAVLDRIFEPYFTTKGVGKGTGLGLAVVRGIVTSLGGTITVISAPGAGTTFTLHFPIDSGYVQDDIVPKTVPTGRGRILLVDDEEMLIDLGKDILVSLGYEVVTKNSSVEALATFRQQPEAFDLVITDMTMPELTGMDLAQELLVIRSGLPIIICTGYSEFLDAQQSAALGIRAYIHKPYTISDLAEVVQKTLKNSGTRQQL